MRVDVYSIHRHMPLMRVCRSNTAIHAKQGGAAPACTIARTSEPCTDHNATHNTYRNVSATVRSAYRTLCILCANAASQVRGPFFKTAPGEHVALLINNLGGSTPMEMSVVARQALTYARSTLQLNVERIYVGPYMTALDMAGASITLLKTQAGTGAETAWPLAGKTLLELLDAATEAPGWSGKPAHIDNGKAPQPLPDLGHHKEASAADGSGAAPATPAGVALGAALRAACEVLVASEAELDALDAKVGDGDCGATLARGAQAVLQALGSNAYNLDHPARAMSQVRYVIISHQDGESDVAMWPCAADFL